MVYYQVIEDNGDGSSRVLNFRNRDNAVKYIEENEEWCYANKDSPRTVDTDKFKFED